MGTQKFYLGFGAQQVGGHVLRFVAHLVAAVDVEAHVVVGQAGHVAGGLARGKRNKM